MDRIFESGAAATPPAVPASPSAGYATGGNPGAAVPATKPGPWWYHMITEEIRAVIEAAGLVPDHEDLGQLARAIQSSGMQVAAAGGTADAITAAYTPAIAALTDGMVLYVRAAGANTVVAPTFTPADGTIAAKAIVKGNDLPLVAGDVAGAGYWAELQYDGTLDKWVMVNPATGIATATAASIRGAFRKLSGSATGLSAVVNYALDELTTSDGAGNFQSLAAWAGTITMTTLGTGGLDVGAVAASTWYYAYGISKPDGTKAFIASLSATGPSFANAAGYTNWARIGAFRTDGTANKYPLSFIQHGRKVQYKVVAGSNVPDLPSMASGVAAQWTAVATGNFVPPTAGAIRLAPQVAVLTSSWSMAVAPNNAFPTSYSRGAWVQTQGGTLTMTIQSLVEIQLESANIYWGSTAAGNGIFCIGWEDNL